jgi:hypothetical protein
VKISRLSAVIVFSAVVIPVAQAQLPVKRVVLYKNGVGYFEHLGTVRGNQDVGISFTSGQLNDVLKSLTVLDLNGGRISGVAYGSSAPADRQLGDLRLPVGEKTTLTDFLSALRGARLEVNNGATVVTGRLLSVERKTRMGSGATLEVDYLSLITDAGEVKTTEVSPGFSVRLLERGLTGKVDRFLDLLSSGREADSRRMTISTEGTGERNLFVSYISEVPVWKATYRLVLDSKPGKSPLVQGWAIVDNTVGQDWENVQLSLVAGAPQSFIQNLSQPYYSRRPVVDLPQSMNISPQTFEATLTPGSAQITGKVTDPTGAPVPGAIVRAYDSGGARVAEVRTNEAGVYELGLADGTYRLEFQQTGFQLSSYSGVAASGDRVTRSDARLSIGGVAQSVTVEAEASTINTESAGLSARGRLPGSGSALGGNGGGTMKRAIPPPPSAPMIAAARAQAQSATAARELGDLFEYKLKEPVTIQKNRSALVPIVQANITAEKVSIWNERAGLPRPQRALWLTNTTGLTLDGGSFSVLEEETFAGEGIFDPIRPDEKRLISYATDLALNVNAKQTSDAQRVTHVTVSRGVLTQESEILEKKTYTFRNEDGSARNVIVEHPSRQGYELRSEVKPAETTPGWLRFRVRVEPKQTTTLVVEEARPLLATYSLSNLKSDQLALFVRQQTVDKTVEAALRKVLVQKAVIDELETKKTNLENETTKIFDDQQRLRENMKALKGTAEEKALVQRYTKQLNDQEDRLEAVKTEGAQLETRQDAAQEVLDRMIQDLTMDVRL